MATDTAAPKPPKTRPDPTRRLWQVPVFLLGVAVFTAAYTGWLPSGLTVGQSEFKKDLANLKAAVERLPSDPIELKSQLQRIAGAAESFPEDEPIIHFTLGSGYVRLAELTPDPADARSYWVLARQHFDSVRPDQLTDAFDQDRLAYRAAKARAADLTGNTPPAEMLVTRNRLTFTPSGEEPGEAPRLVAELSLRMIPPDLKNAKESLAAYLADAGLSTPRASIMRAKLRLGEVLRLLGEYDGAKQWLSQIGRDAPADVIPVAKTHLAHVRMAEHDWVGAAREWEQVRASQNLPSDLRSSAAYNLGVCRLLSKPPDPVAAAPLLEEASKSDGPEASAAAIRLADLRLGTPDRQKHTDVVGLLAIAVKGVNGPGDYKGRLPINEVRAVFELAVQILSADGAFESAIEVVNTYRAVAEGGRDREKRAEVFAAWADAVPKIGGDAAPKFAAAAAEYEALAALRSAPTDKAALGQRAAALYRKAGKAEAAITALKLAVAIPNLPDDQAGPLWVEYASALMEANQPDAIKAFEEAMLQVGPASTTARHHLARLLLDPDPQLAPQLAAKLAPLGRALLEQVAGKEQVVEAEQNDHERAMVELAQIEIRERNFAAAEARLRTQLKHYPAGPQSSVGRCLLGVCLLQRADPKAKQPVPDPTQAREEALGLFKQLVADVNARRQVKKSTKDDEWLYVQSNLRILQAYLGLAKPNEVLYAAAPLRQEFAGRVEELIVLNWMYHAFKLLAKPESMLTVRSQIQDVFQQLKNKPGAFPGGPKEYTREYWEKEWLAPDPVPVAPNK